MQFLLLSFLLFVSPQVIEHMIKPCKECTDFQLTVVTQIGTVLGAGGKPAEGETASIKDLASMNYYVQGVKAEMPK